MDLLVVYSPCGGGHEAAAHAVVRAARARGLRCDALDAFDFAPRWVTAPYLAAHYGGQSRAPAWYGAGYDGTNARGGALEPMRLTLDRALFRPLRDHVRALAPRAIVATHHLPLVVLARERRKGRLAAPVGCVVTDYAAHACWAERGVDRFCVPSARAARDLARHGVEPVRIAWTGVPVRAELDRIAPVRAPRPGERLRVLVTSGGWGVGPMERIVRAFARNDDLELTVVCGRARALELRVRSLAPHARVIGFEREMPARMAEAHVIVGKAGGLTVSEALTAGRPLVLVGAVPGQEKHNEAFVTGGGAGLAVRPDEAARAARFLRDAGLIERMGAAGRALVLPRAAERVLEVCLPRSEERVVA